MDIDIVNKLRNIMTGIGNGLLKRIKVMFHQYIFVLEVTSKAPLGVLPKASLPHISVHLSLIEHL